MRQESKNISINFLNDGFGVKKVTNNLAYNMRNKHVLNKLKSL